MALALAVKKLMQQGLLSESPLSGQIAALSVGVNPKGKIIADLDYEEDYACDTDMNVVMTKEGAFVEVQGTAEGAPFSQDQFEALIQCAKDALQEVFQKQDEILEAN